MAWIKLKSSINNKIISMPKKAYDNFHRNNKIFTEIKSVNDDTEANKKSTKPKEAKEYEQDIQFNDKIEINSSGKNKKETRI